MMTPTESRIVDALAAGRTPEDVAAELGLSRNRLYSLIASIETMLGRRIYERAPSTYATPGASARVAELERQAQDRCPRCLLFGAHACVLPVEHYARSGASATEG